MTARPWVCESCDRSTRHPYAVDETRTRAVCSPDCAERAADTSPR